MREKIVEMIKEVLEEKGLNYQVTNGFLVGMNFGVFILCLEVGKKGLILRVIEVEKVEEKHTLEMLKLLNWINIITKEGHWAIDESDMICYRIHVCLSEHGGLCKERIGDIIDKALQAQLAFGDAISRVGSGMSTAEDVMEEGFSKLTK